MRIIEIINIIALTTLVLINFYTAIVQSYVRIYNFDNSYDVNISYSNNSVCVHDVIVSGLIGESMLPTSQPGNMILLRNFTDKEKIHSGNVVCYTRRDEMVCHRVIGVYEEGVYTKGDNVFSTEFVRWDRIKYVSVGVIYT